LAAFAMQGCVGEADESQSESGAPKWRLVWSDDFDGDALDTSKWTPEESCWGGGNQERQCYTARPENISVSDGVLHLIAKPESYTGPLYPAHSEDAGDEQATQAYTSGKVITLGKADWTFGRISARIKLPAGQGAWAAFWMMPVENYYGQWPLSGEFDIMEAVNLGTPCEDCPTGTERRTSGALHFGGLQLENTYLYSHSQNPDAVDPTSEWHVYSVEWAEGVVQWFVDDTIFMRLTADDWRTESPLAKGNTNAPLDRPTYAIMNLAAGGNLAEHSNGGGFDPSTFPAEMQVDWVRVEQCEGDETTGQACLSDQPWTGPALGPSSNQAS